MTAQFSGIKRFVLWDYPRATWQSDVMVALILLFIFLTPRELFRDQPRENQLVRLPAQQGSAVFWVDPQSLQSVGESERPARVESMLRSQHKVREPVIHIEPIFDSEREVKGYMAYTKR